MTTIRVTAEHIAKGKQNAWSSFPASRTCPIALALQAVLGSDWAAEIGHAYNANPYQRVRFPPEVYEWILTFDKHQTGDPFEFDLDV